LEDGAEPTEEPVQRGRPQPDDEVAFTVGYPGVVTPHIWYSLSMYVHLPRLQAEADQRIADESRWFGLRPASSKAAAHVPLPKGTRLRVSPEVRGIMFNPPAQEVGWLEDLQQVAFRLQATSEGGHTVLGAVEVHAGPLLVAQVPLSIHVRGAAERQERDEPSATSTGRLFSSVFASYAHEDDRVVRAFVEAYRALGIKVLVDKASLWAGEDWRQALSRLIEEADLFQLFWSEAASRSAYVAEEWERALLLQDRKGERFIRPLYWTNPWPPPPTQLAHLHFAALDLAALSRVAGTSGP
jgi:TIR domain